MTIMRTANMPSKKAVIIATTEEAEEVAIKAKAEVIGAVTRKMAEADSNVEVAVISNSVETRTGSVTLSSSLRESPRILEPMRTGAMEAVNVIEEVEDVAVVEAAETVMMVTTLVETMAATSVEDVVSPALIRLTALMSVKMNNVIAETTTRKIVPTSPTKIKVRLRLRSRLPTPA